MLKTELLKSISRFLLPPVPNMVGLPPDIAITNSFRLPDLEDMQLLVVWNSDVNDFTESLIFRLRDGVSKDYICSVRRTGEESVADLVKRTVETAMEKRGAHPTSLVYLTPTRRRLMSLLRRIMHVS